MSQKTTRRSFLKTSSEIAAVTAAVSTLGGVHTVAQEKDARLGIGIIGCGGIMTHHVQGLVGRKEAVEIAWLCDVDPAQIERMSKKVTDGFQAAAPKRTAHYEDVIND